jgi:hypothetical protein
MDEGMGLLSLVLKKVDEVCSDMEGCGDGFCLLKGKAVGQHTNGGCRCVDDHEMRRLLLAFQRLRTATRDYLDSR